jgi:hypothetical protein
MWQVAAGRSARQLIAAVTLAAVIAAGAGTAQADDRDSAVVGKITLLNRKAIEQYQSLNFEEAQRLLREAVDLAEASGLLQHPIRARTYVTLGIVTLGGLKQREEAIKLFRKALQIQPEIKLSKGLANPEIQAAFDEAIEGLTSEPKNEGPAALSPDRALVHDPVKIGAHGQAVVVSVIPDRGLTTLSSIVLAYRPAGSAVFSEEKLLPEPNGFYRGEIPGAAADGPNVAYYLEARDADGRTIASRGSAKDPFVVTLATGATGPVLRTSDTTGQPSGHGGAGSSGRKWVLGLMVGTGFGSISGVGSETQQPVSSGSMAWSRAAHIAPMIGYFVTPQLMLGVQGRFQFVSGANDYHVPDAMTVNGMKECGDGVCSPATGAIAAFVKGTYYFSGPDSAFRPYFSLSVGGGTIRHVTNVSQLHTCGGGTDACVDTVAAGPFLAGPGLGFSYQLSDGTALVLAVEGLIGAPNTTVHADANLGINVAF